MGAVIAVGVLEETEVEVAKETGESVLTIGVLESLGLLVELRGALVSTASVVEDTTELLDGEADVVKLVDESVVAMDVDDKTVLKVLGGDEGVVKVVMLTGESVVAMGVLEELALELEFRGVLVGEALVALAVELLETVPVKLIGESVDSGTAVVPVLVAFTEASELLPDEAGGVKESEVVSKVAVTVEKLAVTFPDDVKLLPLDTGDKIESVVVLAAEVL
ncbi:MAG: hypothetical protein M1829_005668 [Trizodia sp. TS-e1964]|nr:MAG: hypothetical protein M1829_005668 [Trizodia sp. TS-e1964]